jgi:hypothetical protein
MWERLSVPVVFVVSLLSGCIVVDGEASAADREDGYEPGQAVYFSSFGQRFTYSSGSDAARTTEAKASLDFMDLKCFAVTSRDVRCDLNATAAASGAGKVETEWAATFELEDASVRLACRSAGGASCAKDARLHWIVNVTAEDPNGTAHAELDVEAHGLLMGQKVGASSASRVLDLRFTIAEPGAKGAPYVKGNLPTFGW